MEPIYSKAAIVLSKRYVIGLIVNMDCQCMDYWVAQNRSASSCRWWSGYPDQSTSHWKQWPPLAHYIEKNCIQSIQCCISRRSKTAKI